MNYNFFVVIAFLCYSWNASAQVQGLLLSKSGLELGWQHVFHETSVAYNSVRVGGKYEHFIGGISYTNESVASSYNTDKIGLDIGYQIPFSRYIGVTLNAGSSWWSFQYPNGRTYAYSEPYAALNLYGSFEPKPNLFIKPVIGLGYRLTYIDTRLSNRELPFLLGVGLQLPIDNRSFITFLPMMQSLSYYGVVKNYFSTTFGFGYRF